MSLGEVAAGAGAAAGVEDDWDGAEAAAFGEGTDDEEGPGNMREAPKNFSSCGKGFH